MVYETRLRSEEQRSAQWVEAQSGKIINALDALESNRFPAIEGALNFGQLALACALGYLDFRHENFAWRDGRPMLSSWYSEIQDFRVSRVHTFRGSGLQGFMPPGSQEFRSSGLQEFRH